MPASLRAMTLFIDLVGWAGALLVLAAYGLLTLGRLKSASLPYQVMNFFGSSGLALNSLRNHALPSVGLNVVWMAFGLFALYKLVQRRPMAPP